MARNKQVQETGPIEDKESVPTNGMEFHVGPKTTGKGKYMITTVIMTIVVFPKHNGSKRKRRKMWLLQVS
jgi:hypothetical protein